MHWLDVSTHDHARPVDGLDPYAAWVLGKSGRFPAGGVDTGERLLPVLIELRGISIADFGEGRGLFDTPQQQDLWRESIAIPPILMRPPDGIVQRLVDTFEFTTAVVRPTFFDLLRDPARTALRRVVASVSLSRPVEGLELSFRKDVKDATPALELPDDTAPTAEGVVVGIIDDGIAFANESFRSGPAATRVESIWIQSQNRDDPPLMFGRGREIDKATIDAALLTCADAGVFDEERLYRDLGQFDFTSDLHKAIAHRRAHGTHVLDVATGPRPGDDPKWPIIAVQLPVAVTADTSGARLTQWVVEGVWYILLQSLAIAARRGSRPIPVVINLSYGFTAGPHDGSLPLERALQRAVEVWESVVGARVRIVLPAGNHYQTRMHASLSPPPGGTRELSWRIHPDDRTSSHVELWLPDRPVSADCPVRVRVRPPGATSMSQPAVGAPGVSAVELHNEGRLIGQIAHSRSTRGGNVVRISIAPTYEIDRSGGAQAGVWTIQVENAGLRPDESVEAWVQRDDTVYGFPVHGRQSYFEDEAYEMLAPPGRPQVVDTGTGPVRRAGTLNAIATGWDPRIVVVGGYERTSGNIAAYSSSGPTRGERRGPDVIAVSDRSRMQPGVLAAAPRSGARVAMNGTSVAAPQITRILAAELAAGRSGDATFIASIARPPTVAEHVPANQQSRLKERIGAGAVAGATPRGGVATDGHQATASADERC